MIESGREPADLGVRFLDLTPLFVSERETICVDDCCHVNELGNRLMGRAPCPRSVLTRLAPCASFMSRSYFGPELLVRTRGREPLPCLYPDTAVSADSCGWA